MVVTYTTLGLYRSYVLITIATSYFYDIRYMIEKSKEIIYLTINRPIYKRHLIIKIIYIPMSMHLKHRLSDISNQFNMLALLYAESRTNVLTTLMIGITQRDTKIFTWFGENKFPYIHG